ncbi:MAG: ribosome small subunit-dependent GTPase A [Gammaproteobacteria bacterium]|nr:ribosome small subunit-dependent GTPase A [Gammaproteobacteria bacterium]
MRKLKSHNKLTNLQQRRVQRNQDDLESTVDALSGLVIAHYGDQVDVENSLDNIIRCNIRQNLPALAVGDQVLYLPNLPNLPTLPTGVVINLLERKSLLVRNNSAKAVTKPIAANLDQIFIVFAVEPTPESFLIDQFLITAEFCNIQPVLILNKYDLITSHFYNKSNNSHELIEIYKKIGYSVLNTSTHDPSSIQKLEQLLANKNSIFIGPSGVGKSTLTQQFFPNLTIKTGRLSDKILQGKHTTTVAKLYHLANSGNLIDAPGVREIGVSHLSQSELENTYPEFRPYLRQCKFRDCKHIIEPNCAFKSALTNGHIAPSRWENYLRFRDG